MANESRGCRGHALQLADAGRGPGPFAQGSRELRAQRGRLPLGACTPWEQLTDRGVAHVLREGEVHLRNAEPLRGAHEPQGQLLVPGGRGGRDSQDAHPAERRPWQLQRDAGVRPDNAEEEPADVHPHQRLHETLPGSRGHDWLAELPGGQRRALHRRDLPVPLWRHVWRRRPRPHGASNRHPRGLEGGRHQIQHTHLVCGSVHALHDGPLRCVRRLPLQRCVLLGREPLRFALAGRSPVCPEQEWRGHH
mmetsp:Transcript_61278/g.189918  ORF Transcript_61278/g.189918 Transcript_61278/m.189918 type:complete len:250 (-) Transcript_61278:607-1356(-)